ncbi:MAG: bifunctional oligoribonuclease/PAP phosphatase NrnA [Magnetococcales bacterium]|nr:bifunctional oligoribonuclease/PAP phosphatase NrnA [Magnetococcales bacterium]
MEEPGTKSKAAQLAAMLEGRSGERHAVILQDFPDPDAIACGFAYHLLAAERDIQADLIYGGRISHQENIALINLLEIQIIEWTADEIPPNHFQGAVFVDNQGTTSNLVDRLEHAGVPVLAVVDHHDHQNRLPLPLFSDIRPVGACASIFAHYLAEGLLQLRPSNPEHRRLATALMHGIVSETGSMIRAHPFDFTAAAFLQPFYDIDLLMDILHQRRNHKVMEVIRLALANRVIKAGLCLSGVGYLRGEDRDAIPQAADFLLSEDTVHTAVVYGIVTMAEGVECIHGSLRTSKNSLGPDTFLKDVLGRTEQGIFYGGGKAGAGGFEIPLGFLSGSDSEELALMKWNAFDAKIRKKFFKKIGMEEK